ncbi:hypothetical protein [Melittangium boletus]|uniref:Uncharacterized protein n=1 Tax=Melittangium boletus DSM 14713 TaxID=1294270 RepID=A0A250IK52_9BACT|nr:hypothetical protein [Melittangium boletus]ATB32154.1 hypothetical protein MEBOL_005630 [Melittangium boletus DSM 14713]
MFGRLLLWARRNSRRALALLLAPGLVALAFDAAVAHWAGKDFDNRLQAIPVVYGGVGCLLMMAVCVPRSRAVFAWTARLVGVAGVLIGLAGTVFHVLQWWEELGGEYSAASLEGAFSVAPPLLAPLGFSGLGALLFFLPSTKLLLRLRVGSPISGGEGPLKHAGSREVSVSERDERRSA